MYAVIFTAELNDPDEDYYLTAKKMRDLAINEFGCMQISSVEQSGKELTVSYWKDKQSIIAWKNNKAHIDAQSKGKQKWYKNYSVDVVQILQQYKG